jgi:hypothetical protein
MLLLEKHFWDGRRAQVLRSDGATVVRVFTASGRVYLEQTFRDATEATTAVIEWDGNGAPGGG